MGARMKKKYESGAATKYITRTQALKKLQLNLKDFRRLCILKGIYPREPNNRKQAQQGKTDRKTLYFAKDIRFLSHEPLIWKFREFKVFMRKIKTAYEKGDKAKALRLQENKPTLQLDHLVKERYPTFNDALNDLDDCLTLCFFFSTLPRDKKVPGNLIALCRRLTIEFMHYVIAAKALRKVFISIKGIYYQVEIKGQPITVLVNHQRGFKPTSSNDVDYRIMTNFVDFYTTMLGFINFRLYHSINLQYPPKLPGINFKEDATEDVENEEYNELVAALNLSLVSSMPEVEEEPQIDEFPSIKGDNFEEAKKDAQAIKRLQSLFQGLKFFVSREVPREAVVFVIRCCGGEVSWDPAIFPGATYDESDESITHQIVDRPSVDKQHLSRYYIQPQWIFDCVNFRRLLPVEDYFVGADLPPHISPFANERAGEYIPPERKAQMASEENDDEFSSANQTKDDLEDESEEIEEEEEENEEQTEKKKKKKKASGPEVLKENKGMKVLRGAVEMPNNKSAERDDKDHYRFRQSMVPSKLKRLYRSMLKSQKGREKNATRLLQKRKQIDKTKNVKNKKKSTGTQVTAKTSIQPVDAVSETPAKKLKKEA